MPWNKKKAAQVAAVTAEATGSAVKSVVMAILKVLGTILLIGVTTGIFMAFIFAMYVNRYILPNATLDLSDFALDQTSFIYYTDASTGEDVLWEELYSQENRVWVDYEDMPEYLFKAVVAIEDKRFYQHNGVDWKRTGGAFLNMFLGLRSGSFGGSTLTQQLIKNLTDYDEVTVKRKILEIFRALEFEKNYTKEDILEWYLNTVYLGQGCYGIQTAAETYFNKDPKDLTLAECAAIVGITNAPTKYNPYINPDNNKERQGNILREMKEQGIISESEYQAALAEPLNFQPLKTQEQQNSTSYYVDQIITDVIADIMTERDVSKQIATRMLYRGGYKIYAAVDMDIQKIVDEVFSNDENFPQVYGAGDELPQAAISIVDPYTGDVVAMYGGRGAKTTSRGWNRATRSTRQPGSSIKPLTVYGPALELGVITPYSVIEDSPLKKINGKDWPKNQDRRYRGPITVLKAVEISNNAVAAKVVDMISPQRSFDFASKKLGLTTLVSYMEQNGKTFSDIDIAPMALGGLTKGVTVEDMTASYAAYTNKGVYNEPRTYTRIEDSNGELVLDNTPESHVAMQEKTAYYMNEILQSVVARGTGTKAKLKNMPTAGKTGTTDDDYDRWFVGYTPYYTAAVWFGYDTPQEINLKSSLNPALDLWRQVMSRIHENLESRDFFDYPNIVKASYCTVTGKKPSSFCTSAVGYYASGDQPSEVCTGHDGVEWGDMSPSPSPSESESPSVSPSESPSVTPSVTPTVPVTTPPVTDPPTAPPVTDPPPITSPPVVTPQPPSVNPEG